MKSARPEQGWLSLDDIEKDRTLKTRLHIDRNDMKLLGHYCFAYEITIGLFEKAKPTKLNNISIEFEDYVRLNEERGCVELNRSRLPDILAEARELHAKEKRGIH